MMKSTNPSSSLHAARLLPAVTAALAAAGLISTAQAQLQTAGSLLINVDATSAPLGTLSSITNAGTQGGFFEARGGTGAAPFVTLVNGNGTRSMRFDGGDYLQHVVSVGGAVLGADPSLTGANPTLSIEAWVLNPSLSQEETVVAWGHRGGPDGANISLNYGWDAAWGAVGHWGGADIGWDSSSSGANVNPPGNPSPGVWHHLAYTFNGTTQKVFVDGVLKNSDTATLAIHPIPAVCIGAQYDNDSTVTGPLRGSLNIARIRIHSEALTDGQVLGNYNFEKAGFSNGGAPLPFGPSHRYSFNNASGAASSGAVVSDSIGTAHGTVRGNGASFTGSRLSLPGGSSSLAPYVDLPNGLLSSLGVDNGGPGEITIEGFVKNNGSRNWSRVFDFGNGSGGELNAPGGNSDGQDYLFLSACEGGNPYVHILALRNAIPPAGGDVGSGWGTDQAGRDYHFAVTWKEATGEILAYENGSLVGGVGVNPANDKLSTIQDVNVWLGRSNWTGDDNFQGEYDEFRIYPRVLPAEQVKASFDAGANNLATADPVSIGTQPQNQTAPELGSATFSINALGYPVIGHQWFRAPATAIAGANSSSLTLNNLALTNNGAQFFCVASNFIPGTGSFFATSQVATLTVNADLVGPSLVSAVAAGASNILVTFSEDVNVSDAGTAANYSVRAAGTNIAVVSAAASGSRAARLAISAPLGCAYYEVTANNVRDLSAAQNAASNTRAGFLNIDTPGLTHRYTFNEPPTATAGGASIANLRGGAPAVVKTGGGATTLTGTRATLSGGGSATAPYIDLPNGLLSNNSTNRGGTGNLTFEGWVKITGNQSWARIFDFGSNEAGELTGPGGGASAGLDYFFLSAQIGGNTSARRIDLYNGDQGNFGGGGAEYGVNNFNQDFQYVVTWEEASGTIRVYENGAVVTSFTTAAPMSDINDVNVWLGRSNWTVDANTQGEYDEFRVYNRILSTAEIAQNATLGPDGSIGAPQSITLNIANTNMTFPGPTQVATALVNFAGGTSLNLLNSGCLTFQSSNPGVLTVSPSGVLTVVTGGVATITASFNGLTASRVVNVLEDVFPPTLVSARVSAPTAVEIQYSEVVDAATALDSVNYIVYGADGPVAINTIDLHPSQDRVTINLFDRLPLGLVTVEVSLVTDTAPRFNEIAPGSQIRTYFLTVNGLTHRYSFNGTPVANATGAAVPDLAGTADAAVKGNGAAFLGSRLGLAGGSSGSAAYVDLPNGLLSANSTNNGGSGALTFETWVKVTGVQNWSRIFDIGSSDIGGGVGGEQPGPGGGGAGLDYFFLTAMVGTDRNVRRIELRNEDPAGGGSGGTSYATTNFNVDTHIAVTWDERTGQIRTYENGVEVASLTTDDAMSQINDVNVWLGRSNWNGDNNMQGEFDEFRIHSRVMPQGEIGYSYALGADPNFGTLNSVTLGGATTMTATNRQQLSFLGIFSNVPGVNLSGTLSVRYTSSNPSVLSVSPTGVAQALRCGTATVTAWVAGVPSITNTLTINVLNCPPVATPDGAATRSNEPITVPLAKFLNNDSDPEGLPVLFVSASGTSTNGGTVTTGASTVTYTPAPGFVGVDRFSYTISDGVLTATTFVEVVVVNGDIPANNLVGLSSLPGGGYQVRFAGIPGRTYQVQRATAPNGPWAAVATLVSPLFGLVEYQDTNPPQPSAFYRIILP